MRKYHYILRLKKIMWGLDRPDFCTEMESEWLLNDLTPEEREICWIPDIHGDGDADTQFYRDVEARQLQVLQDMSKLREENPEAENGYWAHKFSTAYNECDPNTQLYSD